MVSRIACVGGGPGGLFFATLVKQAHPSVEVTVFERNRPEDTFGFGVVFSDATLAGIHEADPVLRQGLAEHGHHWDRIEVRLKGERVRCGGNGMAAIHRKTLLTLLRRRAVEAGVDLRFQAEVPGDPGQLADYDLIVAADGANSQFRHRLADVLVPEVEVATAKFIWFGTTYMFDGLTFVHERGPHGVFAVHGYPISDDVSTFIVETDEQTWRTAGLDEFDVSQPPGASDEKSKQYLEKLFAAQIDGHELLANNSRWANFRTWRTHRWHAGNVVLLGDSAHTAHFSVGSGTKMAMEDAITLAHSLNEHPDDLATALGAYEAERHPAVEKIQGSARPSLSWWENFGRYHDAFEPLQFAFHFLSRSIGKAKLARRDPEFVDQVERAWLTAAGGLTGRADWAEGSPGGGLRRVHQARSVCGPAGLEPGDSFAQSARPLSPLETPLRLDGLTISGRQVSVERLPDGDLMTGPDGIRVPLRTIDQVDADQDDGAGSEQGRGQDAGIYGLWLAAPDSEAGLPEVFARLADAVRGGSPLVVAVHGGTPLTRSLLAEEARLVHGVPVLMVEEAMEADRAQTLLLSGRADLVGSLRGGETPA
ncbi:FAD-dependent monooxygenase [Phytoactinopolyspora endophytica]|uniref:FAD-dependent monooxygenase n=1 Tax=Phytoactinopolyspora endophytica TaxID=1642495 RepID=UPI00197C3A2D|nr:FAD-dependent monooxygenase [Phytoactinopolyspora endophytica]